MVLSLLYAHLPKQPHGLFFVYLHPTNMEFSCLSSQCLIPDIRLNNEFFVAPSCEELGLLFIAAQPVGIRLAQ